jgi:hypothetical protein
VMKIPGEIQDDILKLNIPHLRCTCML